jgi:hypothetical protein
VHLATFACADSLDNVLVGVLLPERRELDAAPAATVLELIEPSAPRARIRPRRHLIAEEGCRDGIANWSLPGAAHHKPIAVVATVFRDPGARQVPC